MSSNPKRLAYRLLFWGRLLLALGVLALFILVFFSSLLKWSDLRVFLMELQFSGALMRRGFFSLVALIILAITALAGRWYCGILCPLGTLQEAVWRISRLIGGSGTRFISPRRIRYAVPVLAGIGFVIAAQQLYLPMDPISNFGRGIRSVYILFTEGLVSQPPLIWMFFGMFAIILVFSAAKGRRFCDWCPVGVVLGAFVSVAPLKMRLRKYTCVSCGKCERVCPMNCLDSKGRAIDETRCVLCFGCAPSCGVEALEYGLPFPAGHAGRRDFLRKSVKVLASLAGVVYLGGATVRRMFPGLARGENIYGEIPLIMPPGARDADRFFSTCVGCQACVSACPAKIIHISDSPFPEINFTNGYCQYNCTECARVCPTDALRLEDGLKQRTRIGLSSLDTAKCVVITKGEACGACAEVCPPRAVRMERLIPGSPLTGPVFDEEYCIGCGGCFHVCPAEPNAFEITGVSPQTLTPGMRPTSPLEEDPSGGVPFTGGDFPF